MLKTYISVFFISILLCCGASPQAPVADVDAEENVDVDVEKVENFIERIDTLGLKILHPKFSRIDLVCGTMPQKSDTNVIFVGAAAFTGELLKEFMHFNIAGNHVSSGELYKGYRCKRNTGAFVYYNGKWKFCYQNYSDEMKIAAKNGGCAFGQEMIIYKGKLVKTIRNDNNKNQFRALCCKDDQLAIIESDSIITFGEFKQQLLSFGISDAIYIDMGAGWNHAWYRDKDNVIELHPKAHDYCTNWVTFYK
jgi:hypothetical protein